MISGRFFAINIYMYVCRYCLYMNQVEKWAIVFIFIKNLKIKYNRVFGYLIEVTNSFKDRVPYYYERRQTITNAERYVTQELKEVEEKILNCSDRAIKIELSIFEQIKSILSDNI